MRHQVIAPLLFAAGLAGLAMPAQAAGQNPLRVHVLHLQTGQPSPGIRVDLERRGATGSGQPQGCGATDARCRVRELVPAAALDQWAAGDYRVVVRAAQFDPRHFGFSTHRGH